ncbi:hypothetical protein BP5796_00737 [Coleophoma crateriformis]|uniref:Actin-like ATPase domain-containing protein n=1 Tax=Coleophoma crateriformis TaxID=565419 RepID=A0A3D8T8X6_9HELO|nr:hypothetical protein BP5796_00737 [Coleophoma crateriformis]
MDSKEHRVQLERRILSETGSHKLIVGIDYGTTYSGNIPSSSIWAIIDFDAGISYAVSNGNKNIDFRDINIITKWPGSNMDSWKTPSKIAYQIENPSLMCNKFGFEVQAKHVSCSWTKLLLDKSTAAGRFDDRTICAMPDYGMMRIPPEKTAEDVCEDFLDGLYRYAMVKLRASIGKEAFNKTPMECWITLPAIWSEEAKVKTLKAAKAAGFGSRPFDQIFTIAEPEAAAIATLKFYSDSNSINLVTEGENILLCDCGGGTVDITTYKITSVSPRLEFEELCVGIGGKGGSTYIDRRFTTLLEQRFGKDFETVPFLKKGPGSTFMNNFEKSKWSFGHGEDMVDQEIEGIKMDIPGSDYYDAEESSVLLSVSDMKSLFAPVVDEVIRLITQQVKEVEKQKKTKIDRIIPVGGFGESAFLYGELQKWCLTNGNIKLMRPDNPQAAVVRGATIRGLEGLAPRLKQCRLHYGFSSNNIFRDEIDPEQYSFIDRFSSLKYCRHRNNWVVAKVG